MQINEIGKNRTGLSGISDVVGKVKPKGQSETTQKNDRSRVLEESFHDSLQKSMNMEMTAETNAGGTGSENEWRPDNVGRQGGGVISHKEPDFGRNKAESINLRIEQSEEVSPAKEVEARRLSYGECDKIEINVLEGYTLKAKLEEKTGEGSAGGCSIYVEMKDEEGTVRACLFDGAGLRKDSRSAMERIAYAVIHDREEI